MDFLWTLVNSYGYGSNELSALWIVLVIALALILVLVFLRFVPVGLWITSLAAGVHVSIGWPVCACAASSLSCWSILSSRPVRPVWT